MKVIKQDGKKKEFTLSDGSIVSFDNYKKKDYNTGKSDRISEEKITLDEENTPKGAESENTRPHRSKKRQ